MTAAAAAAAVAAVATLLNDQPTRSRNSATNGGNELPCRSEILDCLLKKTEIVLCQQL